MRNNKGFTLVELLVVIAILAILVILAMPNVLKQFNNAKKSSFINEVKTVYDEVSSAFVSNEFLGNTKKTTYSSDTNDLDLGNNIKYCVITDTQGNIKYMEVANGSFYSTFDIKNERTISEYNNDDAIDLPEDYTMDCTKIADNYNASNNKVVPKMCSSETLTAISDGYKDNNYIYKKNQELYSDNGRWQIIKDENRNVVNGYGVKILNKNVETIDESPCSYIDNVPIVSTSFMFAKAQNLSKIDFTNFDTSNVIHMRSMFYYTGSDAETFEIDISNFDTSNVTDMFGMFAYSGYTKTEKWTIGDLSKWDTSKLKIVKTMFQKVGYKKAETFDIGDISGWNMSSVSDLSYMFDSSGYNATTWYIGNLSKWDTSNVKEMRSLFSGAGHNVSSFILDLSNWNTSNVTDMGAMFSSAGINASIWKAGDLSKKEVTINNKSYTAWDTSKVEDMQCMFTNVASVQNPSTWEIGDISNWNVSKVSNMGAMFSEAGRYADYYLDLSGWKVYNMSASSNRDSFNLYVESKIISPNWF